MFTSLRKFRDAALKHLLLIIMRLVLTIVGIVIAAIGGVITYRALFLDPSAAIVITETDISEVPNYGRVIGGLALLVCGAALSFFAALRRFR